MPSIEPIYATQQALLGEAHEHAFAYFGGVFKTFAIRQHDLRGEEDFARIPAGRNGSHHHRVPVALELSRASTATTASGNGLASKVWFRRNWLVPVPEASGLDALNQHILDAWKIGTAPSLDVA